MNGGTQRVLLTVAHDLRLQARELENLDEDGSLAAVARKLTDQALVLETVASVSGSDPPYGAGAERQQSSTVGRPIIMGAQPEPDGVDEPARDGPERGMARMYRQFRGGPPRPSRGR